VPDLIGVHLFRIVQEALANVRKHAQAHQAWVTLRADPRRLDLEVRDDGKGFEANPSPSSAARSFGLTSMRERAESLGGSLCVESQPGSGTRVLVEVPASSS
jgi:signal transduction histidine kinase